MRKISKTRGTEDDVVSSTNGSVGNDEQPEAEFQSDVEKEQDSDSNELAENESESTSTTKESPAKKGKGKGKSKKKKSAKNNKSAVEEEYEVEKVVDSKKIKGKLHYLIRWKGYSADNDTWEPENTLSCPDLIHKFNEEKENSKTKDTKDNPQKKGRKRKANKKETKTPQKKAKMAWDETGDENAEYEVERILEVRIKKNNKREFFIHWKGWSNKFDSWEPESNLNCPELISKFMEKVEKARSVESRELRVAPVTTSRYTLQAPSSGRRLSKRRGQSQRVRYDDAE